MYQKIPILRDVTLRDGLQLTGKLLSAERKVEIVRRLINIGIAEIELGSMANPQVVPSMANSLDVVRELSPMELSNCWIWAATPKQVKRAVAAGIPNIQYCMSVSNSHNMANIGRDLETSIKEFSIASGIIQEVGGRIQLCLATSFTCPFEGKIDPDRVLSVVSDQRTAFANDIVVCDTLGQAIPRQVSELISAVLALRSECRIVFHGHNTWGMGIANCMAATNAGAAVVDGALGGLGGCPFAPGASGNTATEDILFSTQPSWFDPSKFAELVRLSESILEELGERQLSNSALGARSEAKAFSWVIEDE